MVEKWKIIKKYPRYQVSNFGNIRSVNFKIKKLSGWCRRKGVQLKPWDNKRTGYLSVVLTTDTKKLRCVIHRQVALAFIPNPDNLPDVNHKDGNKQNNHVDNLEWVTRRDNILHRVKNKTGFKGVYKGGNKWYSQVWVNGVHTHLGMFKTPELAAEARLRKLKELNINCKYA